MRKKYVMRKKYETPKYIRDAKKSWVRLQMRNGLSWSEMSMLAINITGDHSGETCESLAELYNEIERYREG